jgi:hypothetical protein
MERAMELQPVAEEGSLTLAAEKRLHTAQPSLSRASTVRCIMPLVVIDISPDFAGR